MKSSVETLEGNKVKLSVEVDEHEFEKALDAAFRKIAREVRIPGFRPGKAPRRLLEARLGSDVARGEALRDSLPEYYSQAVREHDVDVIAPPDIEITGGQEEGPVAFDAVVEVRPQISVPGYGGLRVSIPSPVPTDADIDAQIDRLRDQFAELQVVGRPAADGDHVTISISGSQHGEPVEGLTADDYLYEVGRGGIAPELDEHLRGSKVGDVLEFDAQPPDPEQAPVQFRVLVKDIKEKVLPEVDDEWANEASEFDTVDELRADIAGRIANAKRVQAHLAVRERVGQALIELVEDDAPEPLVAAEMQRRVQDMAMRLGAQGIDLEQWLDATGQNREEFVAKIREAAVEGVKADLALRAVADAEGFECTDDDLDAELQQVAERVGHKVDRVRRDLERAEQMPAVRSDVRKRKALDWLIEHVEIVDEGGQPIDRADLELVSDTNEADGDPPNETGESADTDTEDTE